MNKINYNASNAYKLCNKFGLDFHVCLFLGKVRFFSSSERRNYIVLLPNVKYKDHFISSFKNELLLLKNTEFKLSYYLQTRDGYINFWDEIENQFAWSENNIYDEHFKDGGYQEDWDQFVRYSIVHSDLFHKNKVEDMYVKGVYDKLVSKESSDVRHTILRINKVFEKKLVRNKSLRSLLDINKKRFYSSMNGDFTNKLNYIDNNNAYIFTNLEKILDNNPRNEKTQVEIEKFLHNQGKHILEDTSVLGVNINYLNNNIKKYCFEKADLMKEYLTKLSNNLKTKHCESYINSKSSTKKNDFYTFKIVSTVKLNDIINLMLYVFLKIVTFHNMNSDDELYNGSTSNNILLGRLLVSKYFTILKDKDISNSEYKKQFLEENKNNSVLFTDDFYLHLGSKLTEIMIECGLFIFSSVMYKELNHSVFKLADEVKNAMPLNNVILAPLKLPMIIEPKSYDKDKLGGYLLNDVEYDDGIITKKIGLKEYSRILDNNIIYCSVNGMMKTAFKINKNLLNYLIDYNHEHKLLTMNEDSIYKNIEESSLDSKEKKLYQKYLSKKLLHDYVIRIAILYKNVPEIFFPIRMDNRGRLYPMSAYLHYQSCELAKALLLFARPDFIKRSDKISINYLKAYGATCFGNKLDKKSYDKRLEWVDDNWNDLLNYKNNILLNKAENKYLFLAFCMEIERFNNFLNDDSTLEFKTYLPIQLDGTCNGYQHLALLSNEVVLYDKLNLTGKSKDPSDFYTYIINQLNIHLEKKSKLTKKKEDK